MKIQDIEIEHLNEQSTFRINNSIVTDPFQINQDIPAKLILISHPHYDHCSLPDLKKIITKNTIIITVPDCQSKLAPIRQEIKEVKLIFPNQEIEVNNVKIKAIPAYNINKNFHPKQNEWIGFIITTNNKKIYFAGDTDIIPEMESLQDIDIALLPIGGTYTMDHKEAAKAVNIINPKTAIPMHYGINLENKTQEFKDMVKNSEIL